MPGLALLAVASLPSLHAERSFPFVHLLFTPCVWRRIKQGRFTLEEPRSDARPSSYLVPGSGGL